MGAIRFLAVRLAEVTLVVLLIIFLPNIPPKANFSHFKVSPSLPLEGKLQLNDKLNNIERLYEDELKGPEAFAIYNGELYTSIHGGDVVKLSKGHIVPIAKFGKPCTGHHEEKICGRPLGLAFDKNGVLYVADAYYGIWKVDVNSGKKTLVVSMDEVIDGKKVTLPNSLVVASNGDIYWTESSTEFQLDDSVYILLADATGRLIHYNSKTKQNTVLLNGFHFANGLILSPNENFLLISETLQSRIMRYYLTGPKKNQHDIFIDSLPGLPDNLQLDPLGAVWVPLVTSRDTSHPLIFQIFGPFPHVRKFFARANGIAHSAFKTIHKIYPNFYTERLVHYIGHLEPLMIFAVSRVTVMRISLDGDILEVFHSDDKSITGVSHAIVHEEHLYLGSPYNSYVGRINLDKLGLGYLAKQQKVRREAPAPPPKVKETPTKQQAPPPKVKETPTKKVEESKQQAPPTMPPKTAESSKQHAPPPKVKETPTKQQAPLPKVKETPTKQAPPPKVKETPTKKAEESKQQAPPTTPPKTADNRQQTPPPKVKETPTKQQAPPPKVKETPTKKAEESKQQTPPPKVRETTPTKTTEREKQAPPTKPPKTTESAPPKVQQAATTASPKAAEPAKQTPPAAAKPAPTQQQAPASPARTAESQPAKQTTPQQASPPRAVPVRENVRPKSESVPPRK